MNGCFALLALAISAHLPQPVVLGPFPLGDLLLANPADNWVVDNLKAAGVDVAEVKKGMNGWKMSVIDYKIRKSDGRWTWYRPKTGDSGPTMVVTGRLSVEVKDRHGKKVEIALTEVQAIGSDTYHAGKDVKTAFVATDGHATLRFNGLEVPRGLFTDVPKEGGLEIPKLMYDTTGRSKFRKP